MFSLSNCLTFDAPDITPNLPTPNGMDFFRRKMLTAHASEPCLAGYFFATCFQLEPLASRGMVTEESYSDSCTSSRRSRTRESAWRRRARCGLPGCAFRTRRYFASDRFQEPVRLWSWIAASFLPDRLWPARPRWRRHTLGMRHHRERRRGTGMARKISAKCATLHHPTLAPKPRGPPD